MKNKARFLETITGMGYEALVPINKIKFIYIKNMERWEINIFSEGLINDEDSHWIECFENNDAGMEKLNKRWNMLKEILNAK